MRAIRRTVTVGCLVLAGIAVGAAPVSAEPQGEEFYCTEPAYSQQIPVGGTAVVYGELMRCTYEGWQPL